jgi:hypothetical protein
MRMSGLGLMCFYVSLCARVQAFVSRGYVCVPPSVTTPREINRACGPARLELITLLCISANIEQTQLLEGALSLSPFYANIYANIEQTHRMVARIVEALLYHANILRTVQHPSAEATGRGRRLRLAASACPSTDSFPY